MEILFLDPRRGLSLTHSLTQSVSHSLTHSLTHTPMSYTAMSYAAMSYRYMSCTDLSYTEMSYRDHLLFLAGVVTSCADHRKLVFSAEMIGVSS